MSTPAHLTPLLILQDRDKRRRDLADQLKAIPSDIATVESRITRERTAIETARTELRSLEAKKKLLETEIAAAQGKIAKYRTQQLEVRKNDEYRALGTEIEHTEGVIGKLEEEEIGILYAIEEAKKKFAAAEAELQQNIHGHETRLRALREKIGVLTAEHTTAEADYTTARTAAGEPLQRAYDRACLRQKPPVCLPAIDGKCSGCHLKLSGDIETAVRTKGTTAIVFCDNCGRILWWE